METTHKLKCQRCGRSIWKAHRCRTCGRVFCQEHSTPGSHDCIPGKTRRRRAWAIALVMTAGIGAAALAAYSQREILWQKQIRAGVAVESIASTEDGGYIMAGHLKETDGEFLVRLDPRGKTLWEKSYTTPDASYYSLDMGRGCAVKELSDGSFVLLSNLHAGGMDRIRVLRTDPDGNPLWEHTYGDRTATYGFDVAECSGCDLILVGAAREGPEEDLDVYLARLESSGEMVWERTHGANTSDWATRILETGGEQYVVLGRTTVPSRGYDTTLLLINGEGEVQSERTYGGEAQDYPNEMIEGNRGGLTIAGWTNSFGTARWSPYLLAVDSSFDTAFEGKFDTLIPGTHYAVKAFDIVAWDGYHLLSGTLQNPEGFDGDLMLVDGQGNILWEKAYPDTPIYTLASHRSGAVVGGSKGSDAGNQTAFVFAVRLPRMT